MGFFNDVGNWINDNIIQPIGNVWNSGIERMKKGETIFDQIDKKLLENGTAEKWAKGIEDFKNNTKIGQDIIIPAQDWITEKTIDYNPILTDKAKEEAKQINENIKNGNPPKTTKEEKQGNLQEIGNTQNTPSIEELWAREDAIRKETQEREDTAYQRAIEDMRKAGINPNLVGINPASSGGGITQATGQQSLTTAMSGIIEQTIAEINNTVKANENQKDRINDIIKSFAQVLAMKILLKK